MRHDSTSKWVWFFCNHLAVTYMKNVTENNQLCPEMIFLPQSPAAKFRGQDRRRPDPNGCTCLIEVAAAAGPVAASAGCAGMRFGGCFIKSAVCRVCVGVRSPGRSNTGGTSFPLAEGKCPGLPGFTGVIWPFRLEVSPRAPGGGGQHANDDAP